MLEIPFILKNSGVTKVFKVLPETSAPTEVHSELHPASVVIIISSRQIGSLYREISSSRLVLTWLPAVLTPIIFSLLSHVNYRLLQPEFTGDAKSTGLLN